MITFIIAIMREHGNTYGAHLAYFNCETYYGNNICVEA